MTAAKLRQLSALLLALTINTGPALALAEDIDEVRPHGYTPGEQIKSRHFHARNHRDLEFATPDEAKKMADTMKTALDQQNQKYNYTQDGNTHTIVVESTKKTMVFKAVSPEAAKKELHTAQALAELFPKNEQIASLLSRMYEADKNWLKALEYYRKANNLGDSESLTNAVSKLNNNSKASEARQQAHYAYFELMMKHYETAIRMLSKSIELHPEYLTSYYNRAKAYRALHKNELAEKDEKKFRELVEKDKQTSVALQPGNDNGTMALFMVEIGALEEGLRQAEASLKKSPNAASALLAQARANLRLGRYAQALAAYKKLEPMIKDATNLKAEMAPAATLAKQGPPPYGDLAAIAAMPPEEFVPRSPQSPNAAHIQRPAHHGKGAFSLGMRLTSMPTSLKKLAADHKGDYRVYRGIADGLKEKTMYKQLDAELNKMLSIVPDDSKVIERKIETTEALRDWAGSEKYCNIYIQQLTQGLNGPINTDFVQYAFGVRALARRAQKNIAGAIEDDTTVLKLSPESYLAYRDRGDCYRLTGKYDQAVADYTKAIQLDMSKGSGNYWRRAKAYEKLNKSDLAKQDIETAKKVDLAHSKL
ncbi:hypothetical protein BH11CYA1_BH11CYA1_27160 [soil metagenome]